MYLIETIVTLITGELHSLTTTAISSAISISVSIFNKYNIFLGWCVGLCFESALLSVIPVIFIVLKKDK